MAKKKKSKKKSKKKAAKSWKDKMKDCWNGFWDFWGLACYQTGDAILDYTYWK
jgi:hypothetical protein